MPCSLKTGAHTVNGIELVLPRSKTGCSFKSLGGIGAYSTGPDGKVVRPYIGGLTPVQNLIGIITPAALHYHSTHGYPPPDIDPQQHRLLIHGVGAAQQ